MEQIKPDKRYLLAPEEDLSINISLKTNFNDLNEFTNSRLIRLTQLFNDERNKSIKYRIYGNINYVSFLTNKKRTTNNIVDLFNDDYPTVGFNFYDYFDLKIFKQTIVQTTEFNTTDTYVENLSAITNDSNYSLSYFGFSRNIYNEKIYSFKFDTLNLDPHEYFRLNDNLIYNNYVYLGFMPKNFVAYEKVYTNSDYKNELDVNTVFGYSAITFTTSQILNIINGSNFNSVTLFNEFLSAKTQNFFKTYDIKITDNNVDINKRFIRNYLDIGNGDYKDKIELDLTKSALTGNLIFFDKENYLFNEITKKEYVIKMQLIDIYTGPTSDYQAYIEDNTYDSYDYIEEVVPTGKKITIDFYFKFNPFYKLELKRYETIFEEVFDLIKTNEIIPDNAVNFQGRTVWRNLMTYGDINNYDFPFVNDTHYYFNDIRFYLKPDLSDKNTAILIKEFGISFQDENFIFDKNKLIIKPEQKSCST
jgi:hypothetical protein